MEALEKILNFNVVKLSTFLLTLFSNICPPFMFLVSYNKDIIYSLDIFKLSILCISIMFPIWLINFYFISRIITKKIQKTNEIKINVLVIITSLVSIPILYIPGLTNLYYKLTIKEMMPIIFFLEIILIIYFLITLKRK
jgi:hypothetical protein